VILDSYGGVFPTTIDTTTGWNGSQSISPFGEGSSATYGQTFTVSIGNTILNSFSFYLNDGHSGDPDPINFVAYVMAWDGSKATGSILYESAPQTTAGAAGFELFSFNTGGLALNGGQQYIAFLSTSTQFDGQDDRGSMATVNDAYAGGGFYYFNNGSDFGLLTTSAWNGQFNNRDTVGVFQFKANSPPTGLDPSTPTLAGSYDTPNNARDVSIVGNYAYVADAGSGLQVIDISNPNSPTLVGTYDTPNNARDVSVVGNYAYVADSFSGLQVIDISNPNSPTLAGTYDTPGFARGVSVVGTYVYVADDSSGLQVIDISNPNSPTLAGSYNTPGSAWNVSVVGNYAYVADEGSGLQVIDISNPNSPTLAGTYNTPGSAYGVSVVGNYAYVADALSGLQVIDISTPNTPTLVGTYDTPDIAEGVSVVGSYAYVADWRSGLQMIDISNPTAPTLAGTYNTPGNALGVSVVGTYVYVADDGSGLQVIDIGGDAITITGTPQEDSLLTADVSTLMDADGLPNSSTYSYQWQQSNDGGSTWANISGATSSTFTPGDAQASQQVRVQMSYTDLQGTLETITSASVTIADVNDAPTALSLDNTTTSLAEDTDTSSRIKVADITITDDTVGTNTISLTGPDAASFEVVGTELFLKAGTALDFETKTTYDVTVEVDDTSVGSTPDLTQAFSLSITNVNDVPSTLSLDNTITSLAENTDTSSRIKVADITITDDALGTNTISLSGTDAASFEVDGTVLYLKANTSLDHETKTSYAVTVEVDDTTVGSTPDLTQAFTLNVTDVNEAPTVLSLDNTTTSLAENTDTSNRIKVADITITDDALGTNTISLTGTDAANFEVVGTELFLKAGTALDFETKTTYDVTVEVDDTTVGSTPDLTQAFSLNVTDVNEAPTALELQNTVTTLTDDTDTSSRTKVADIAITDDALGTNTISLSGTDAASFEVDGTVLYLKANTSLDALTKSSYAVTINVDDTSVGATPDLTDSLVVAIADASSPTVTLSSSASSPINAAFSVEARFSESVVGFDATDITVSSGTISNVNGSGDTYTFDVTPTADGTVTVDIAAGIAQDSSGNGNIAAAQFSIEADATPPATPTITSNLNQNTTSPSVSGTAEADTTVFFGFDLDTDGTPDVAYQTIAIGGTWAFDLDSAVPITGSTPTFTDGDTYTIIVGATDAATNPSAPGVDTLTIDTSAPDAPAVTSSETQNSPVISGSAEEGSTITVEIDSDDDGSPDVTYEVTVTGGTWSIDLANDTPTTGSAPTVTDGDRYGVTITTTDAAGNTGPSSTQTLTIDQTPPAAPSTAPTVEGGDTTTDDTTPTLTGSGEVGSTVEIFANGDLLGTATVGDDGNWSFTPAQNLADGSYTFTYTLTDVAGNTSSALTGLTLTIESLLEFATTIPEGKRSKTKNVIKGTTDKDRLRGTQKADQMVGKGGHDRMIGRNGDDVIRGGGGNDKQRGGKGNDKLLGQGGKNRLIGNAGDDYLKGGNRKDVLKGGSGNDILIGRGGNDTLVGGSGADMFVFNKLADAKDTIKGFNVGEDVLDIRRIFAQASYAADSPTAQFKAFVQITQVGANTEVRIDANGSGAGTQLTTLAVLNNVSATTIDSSSFVVF
jgi:hypothetical protein